MDIDPPSVNLAIRELCNIVGIKKMWCDKKFTSIIFDRMLKYRKNAHSKFCHYPVAKLATNFFHQRILDPGNLHFD